MDRGLDEQTGPYGGERFGAGQGLGGGRDFLQSELVKDRKLLGTFLWGSLRTRLCIKKALG